MTCLKRLNDNLGQTLCETAALEAKVRHVSWNLKGLHAAGIRGMLRAQYDELRDAVDGVVEAVFYNGYKYCHGGFRNMAQRASITDAAAERPTLEALRDLIESYEVVLISTEKVKMIAAQQGNFAVEKNLLDNIVLFKRHISDLRAVVS